MQLLTSLKDFVVYTAVLDLGLLWRHIMHLIAWLVWLN